MIWQVLRFGIRTLVKHPGFLVVSVLTLGLGIGANSAIFSVINGVLLRALPYQRPDQLVMVWEASRTQRNNFVSHKNFSDWRAQNQSFALFSAYSARWGGPETILGGTEPTRGNAVSVYRDFFATLGVAPVIGRSFTPEEAKFGSAPVAVVSHRFWQHSLNADPNLTDKKLQIGGLSLHVIGVMPQGFDFPAETDVWLSKEQLSQDNSARSSHNYIGIARLKPNVTLQQAQAEMSTLARHIIEQDTEDKQHDDIAVIAMKEQLTGPIHSALWVLFVAVGFVLLIACANVANLLLARAVGRQKEIAIRTALGASRWQIVRQLLTESLLLAFTGGVIGLGFAYGLVRALLALAPATIPRLNEIGIDSRTLVFTLGTALLTSLLCGLVPALKVSKPDLNGTLKESGRSTNGGSGFARSALVIVEVALTLVLLVGAGLLVKSLWRVLQINPGFNPDATLTMQVSLPSSAYENASRKINFYRQFFERIKTRPGIEAAGMINNLPLGGVDINGQFGVAGRSREQFGYASYRVISPEYFRTMNIPLLKGRYLSEQDNESSEPVAVISQRVAESFFKDEDPLGKRILSVNDTASKEEFEHPERWPLIVGVVGDVKHFGLERRSSADLYFSYAQRPLRIGDMAVVLRTNGDPANFAATVRQVVKDIDPNLPVNFEAMQQIFDRSIANRRYNVLLLGVFAAVALLLAIIGMYGVMSHTVSQGTREIGIRMALGAQASDVLRLVVGQGLVLTTIGIGIGLIGAWGLMRLISTLLFGVTATDPLTFVGVAVLLLLVSTLACVLPARRATKVDPMVALRYE